MHEDIAEEDSKTNKIPLENKQQQKFRPIFYLISLGFKITLPVGT